MGIGTRALTENGGGLLVVSVNQLCGYEQTQKNQARQSCWNPTSQESVLRQFLRSRPWFLGCVLQPVHEAVLAPTDDSFRPKVEQTIAAPRFEFSAGVIFLQQFHQAWAWDRQSLPALKSVRMEHLETRSGPARTRLELSRLGIGRRQLPGTVSVCILYRV